ncbi:hypothetical protein MPLB_2410006 [Mesorhizobium sp. ORS 3324]|nr:hypothetical protein MPLB_2410006 [Mesorhizobium sp. ORS 3324]
MLAYPVTEPGRSRAKGGDMPLSRYGGVYTPADLDLLQRVFDRLCGERRLAKKDRKGSTGGGSHQGSMPSEHLPRTAVRSCAMPFCQRSSPSPAQAQCRIRPAK